MVKFENVRDLQRFVDLIEEISYHIDEMVFKLTKRNAQIPFINIKIMKL